jgi:NAD(P)-dependent dehydrogenase (short-subunit alcohol dehydrogenase family)
VIISGAGSDTGHATTQRLSAEGASLVLLGSDREREAVRRVAATIDATTPVVTGDIAARATAHEAVQAARRAYGRLDGLVTHAEAAPEHVRSAEALVLLDRLVNDEVRSTYLLAQEAARAMTAGGSIVCASAPGATEVERGLVAHNVVAGAITQLARSLAVALAPYGIRANAVTPGGLAPRTATGAHRTSAPEAQPRRPVSSAAPRPRGLAGRRGHAEEVAAVIAFLLSDEASYLTGAVLPVDGGASVGPPT